MKDPTKCKFCNMPSFEQSFNIKIDGVLHEMKHMLCIDNAEHRFMTDKQFIEAAEVYLESQEQPKIEKKRLW